MVEMVGAAFEASGKMENLPSGAGELAGSRDLTQLSGDLSIMLRISLGILLTRLPDLCTGMRRETFGNRK